jgi:hypothetical protein
MVAWVAVIAAGLLAAAELAGAVLAAAELAAAVAEDEEGAAALDELDELELLQAASAAQAAAAASTSVNGFAALDLSIPVMAFSFGPCPEASGCAHANQAEVSVQ